MTDPNDIVQRLRALARAEHDYLSIGDEAADLILALTPAPAQPEPTQEAADELWAKADEIRKGILAAQPEPPKLPPLTDDMLRYAMAAMGTGSPREADSFRLFWRFASEAYRTAKPEPPTESFIPGMSSTESEAWWKLHTPAGEFERGRQQGMKQERALWKLAAEGQAIEAELSGNSGSLPEPLPAGVEPVAWKGGEEWEALAWHLCAEECGEEACTELIWEGGPVPEPWGDRWMKYEGAAKAMIATVRKFTPPTLTDDQCDAIQEAVWVFEMSRHAVGSDEMRDLIRAAAAGVA